MEIFKPFLPHRLMFSKVSIACVSIFIFVIIFGINSLAFATTDVELKNILGGKIKIFIPEDFNQLSEEARKSKWPSENFRPFLVYADKTNPSQIAFFKWQQKTTPENISQIKDEWVNNIKNNNPSAYWYTDEIKAINGRVVGILEYTISNPNSYVRTYNLSFMAMAPFEGKLLIVYFQHAYTDELPKEQRQLAYKVINSVELKPNIFSYSRGFSQHLKTGLIFLIGGSILFYRGFRIIRTRRRWIDLPLSKIRSLAVGPVRIQGKLTTDSTDRENSPLTNNACLFWAISIEDVYWNYATKGWRLIDYRGGWVKNLYLQDESGRVKIDPSEFICLIKPNRRFITFPLRRMPQSIQQLLDDFKVSARMGILGLHLPIIRILRIEESILNESEEIEVVGFAKSLSLQNGTAVKQSERLVITNSENTDFVIIPPRENIFKNKEVLFSIIGGSAILSTGLGLITRSYSLIQSNIGFIIAISVLTTFAILSTIGYYKRWGK